MKAPESPQWLKHIFVYGVGAVALHGVSLLVMPIYTRRISPHEYGILEILNRIQDLMILMVIGGFGLAALAFYQFEVSNPERRARVFPTALYGVLINGLLLSGSLLIAAPSLSSLLLNTPNYAWVIRFFALFLPLEAAVQIGMFSLQAEMRSTWYVGFAFARTALAVVVNLILVLWLKLGLWGILVATLIHTALAATVLCTLVFLRSSGKLDWRLCGEMFRYGFPFVVGGLIRIAMDNGDRFFLQAFAGAEIVGVYGVGYRLGSVLIVVVLTPFTKVWGARMVEVGNRTGGELQIARAATYLAAVYLYSGLILALAGPQIVRWFVGKDYWGATAPIPLVILAYLFWGLNTVADTPLYAKKKTAIKPLLLGACFVFTTSCYALLIPRYGMMGAATATVLSYGFLAFITTRAANRYLAVRYEFGRIAVLFAVSFSFYVFGNLTIASGYLSEVAASLVAAAIFPPVLYFIRFWSPAELCEMKSTIRAFRSWLDAQGWLRA